MGDGPADSRGEDGWLADDDPLPNRKRKKRFSVVDDGGAGDGIVADRGTTGECSTADGGWEGVGEDERSVASLSVLRLRSASASTLRFCCSRALIRRHPTSLEWPG